MVQPNGTGQFAGGATGFDVISRISRVDERICDNFGYFASFIYLMENRSRCDFVEHPVAD